MPDPTDTKDTERVDIRLARDEAESIVEPMLFEFDDPRRAARQARLRRQAHRKIRAALDD